MSFPPGTEMFQFPGFAFDPYEFRTKSLHLIPEIRNQTSAIRKFLTTEF
jgi:hypothetical protein